MAIETLLPGALRYLDGRDLDLLLSLGYRRSFLAGETLHARGERVDTVTIVEEGEIEVEGARRLGPGEIFGASALAGGGPAEGAVRAATDVAAVTVSLSDLEALARDSPEAAARLCMGLATQLAVGRVVPPAEPPEGPAQAAGAVTEDGIVHPFNGVDSDVREAHAAARRLQRVLASETPPAGSDEARWAWDHLADVQREMDGFVGIIRQLAGSREEASSRVTQAAREELRPLLERSRLAEIMNARGPDEPARYRSIVHVYRNHPEGEAADGLLLDACLLDRPFCRALRERRTAISDRVNERIRRRAASERVVRILSLGCGPARSLADVLEQPGMAALLSVTAVDDDQEAIVYANNLLKSRAPNGDITFHQSRPTDLALSEIGHQGYDIIASLFVADYLDTQELAALIRQAHERLNPGGIVLMAAFSDADLDRAVADLFLNWRPAGHAAVALGAALAGSPYGEQVDIMPAPSGLNLVVAAGRVE